MTPYWILDRNLILQAGAGTGKTHALVTLALHILSGATERRAPVPASRFVALTFTEKAGAEMRERLLTRLEPLADGASLDETEPELAESFRYLGKPPPTATDWKRIRRDIPLASIGTFHGFYRAQLVKLAGRAGLDPAFEMMDTDDANALFDHISRDYILAALTAGDAGFRALVGEYGLAGENDTGVVSLVRTVLYKLWEDGTSPDALDGGRFSDTAAADGFVHAQESLRISAVDLNLIKKRWHADRPGIVANLLTNIDALTVDNSEEVIERIDVLRRKKIERKGEAAEYTAPFLDCLDEMRSAAAGIELAPLGRAFITLLAAIDQRYLDAKRKRNALDFSDLQRMLRDLLRSDAEARELVKSRFDAMLVDEFQDTSRIQLDLISLINPGVYCLVGDRKQSIYEFRGADVSVFARAHEALSGQQRVEYLTTSRRSRPALVALANTLFSRIMVGTGNDYEIAFGDGDVLHADLKEAPTGPLAELIEAEGDGADDRRVDEAGKIAARIDDMIHAPDRMKVRLRGSKTEWRQVEGRDIAILFRGLPDLDVYRDALNARGIAHVVVGGWGFYTTREVLDAWALLRALDDGTDIVASVALLRSPWCSLRDATITRLSLAGDRFNGVMLSALLEKRPTLDDPAEQERLSALLDFAQRGDLDRLGAAVTLRLALRELDYLAVASVLPEADAVGANIEKLLSVLERFDASMTTPRAAVRALTQRIREPPREAEAPTAEESDPRSVQLMTIHMAKGLEFPVVFIADGSWGDQSENKAIGYERDLGLGLTLRQGDKDERTPGPRLRAIRDRINSRGEAEDLRLLYVAVTRARDYLVVTGAPKSGFAFDHLTALGPELVKKVPDDLVSPAPLEPAQRAVSKGGPDLLQEKPVQRNSAPFDTLALRAAQGERDEERSTRIPIHHIITTVTRLRDFSECPERYRLRHEIGLAEPGAKQPTKSAPPRAEGAVISKIVDEQFQLAILVDAKRRMDVRGRIDLITINADRARVQSRDADQFHLATYGVATHQMLRESTLPIDIGSPFDSDVHVATLRDAGGRLMDALATNLWPRLDVATCQKLDCGFISKCHGVKRPA